VSEISSSTPPPSAQAAVDLLRVFVQLHGLTVSSHQLVHEFAKGATGWDETDALKALQSLGLETKRHKGSVDQLAKGALPVIAFSKDGVMLVVGQVTPESVVFQRAGAKTPEALQPGEFAALWSGSWISARKKPSIMANDANGASAAPMRRFGVGWFWEALQKYRLVLGEVLMASFFVQIFALITPLVFQVVIDKVLTHRTLNTLDVLVLALVGVSIFEVVLGAMRHYLFSHTTNRVDVELGSKLFKHLMHLPLNYFESRRSGDTVARVRELENARSFLTGQALTSWLDLFFAVVFLAVMFYYSPTLTFIVLASLPVFFCASLVITPLLRGKLEDKFALGAENQAFLVETVTSMETLKSHAVEPQWQREWDKRLADYVNAAFEAGHLANATNQFISLASKLLTVILLWVGARLVIDGELTVGGLIAFNMLSGRVNAPILKLASLWQDFTQMKVSMARLADIMDAQPEPAFRPDRVAPPEMRGAIEFDHVGFRYSPKSPEILKDLSFTVQPGEVVGVVGVSGAGKTTLMRLIQRLYTPEQGRVMVDGMDLALADTAWLRRQMGVVGQDTALFNRSVFDNIAFGDPSMGIEQVMRCAQLAGAHEFILQLPLGYDTLIGERGSKLSGGQRARIAIARALATNPKVLLLDEATAALDYESERAIHDNMTQICAGRTVFIVAHRLPTLRLANRILVLDAGRVVEVGSHAELIQKQGRYASLYKAHQVLEEPA
jgi:subfamily B ATP-binding cassette protein HlyB/CyaB